MSSPNIMAYVREWQTNLKGLVGIRYLHLNAILPFDAKDFSEVLAVDGVKAMLLDTNGS
jgi:hypothetical protein